MGINAAYVDIQLYDLLRPFLRFVLILYLDFYVLGDDS